MLRFPRTHTASLALPLVVSLLLAACSGGGDDASTTSRPKSTTTTSGPVKIALGDVHIESAGPDVKLDAPTQKAVLDSTTKYVDSAIVAPLRDGKLGKAYASLFDPNVQKAATTTDRETLTDLSVGKATKGYKTTVTPIRIEGIADQAGKLLYVASVFQVNATTTTAAGPVTISRVSELTFSPGFGQWKVTAYRTLTTRKAATKTTTTTAASSGGPSTTKKKP